MPNRSLAALSFACISVLIAASADAQSLVSEKKDITGFAARKIIEVVTPLGSAHVKVKELDGRAVDVAPEYEDCRRIARESGKDLRDVMRLVADAARRDLGLD